MTDLMQGMANFAASKYSKTELKSRLTQALKDLHTKYDVPKDQLTDLEAQAKDLLELVPTSKKSGSSNG